MIVCTKCCEPVEAGQPTTALPVVRDDQRWRHRHLDGEPLCPEVTDDGLQPCHPYEASDEL